jgi:hypothetical protein
MSSRVPIVDDYVSVYVFQCILKLGTSLVQEHTNTIRLIAGIEVVVRNPNLPIRDL